MPPETPPNTLCLLILLLALSGQLASCLYFALFSTRNLRQPATLNSRQRKTFQQKRDGKSCAPAQKPLRQYRRIHPETPAAIFCPPALFCLKNYSVR